MIVHVVEQGGPEWIRLRLGIPTSSEFDKILTPAKLEVSAQARGYAFRLAAEKLLQAPVDDGIGNMKWVERGKELEPEAVRMYEFETGLRTNPAGFVTTNDGRLGASPDRLVCDVAGGVELKCPAPHTQVGYILDGIKGDYVMQVQGQMLVAELDWVDRYAYHPEMPPVRVRTYRDEPYIRKVRSGLEQFLDFFDMLYAKLLASGAVEQLPPQRPIPGLGNHHVIVDPFADGAGQYVDDHLDAG